MCFGRPAMTSSRVTMATSPDTWATACSLISDIQAPTKKKLQRLEREPHQREGVVIGSRPDVKTVLLDPLSIGRIASARGLAPKAPAELVHGDLVFFSVGIDFGQ